MFDVNDKNQLIEQAKKAFSDKQLEAQIRCTELREKIRRNYTKNEYHTAMALLNEAKILHKKNNSPVTNEMWRNLSLEIAFSDSPRMHENVCYLFSPLIVDKLVSKVSNEIISYDMNNIKKKIVNYINDKIKNGDKHPFISEIEYKKILSISDSYYIIPINNKLREKEDTECQDDICADNYFCS
jgi:hypothetical protein